MSEVPRVAVKLHLDGDSKPRADEIDDWNALRVVNGLEVMLALILLPNEEVEGPFPRHEMHWWEIREHDGEIVCEPTNVDLEIVP